MLNEITIAVTNIPIPIELILPPDTPNHRFERNKKKILFFHFI